MVIRQLRTGTTLSRKYYQTFEMFITEQCFGFEDREKSKWTGITEEKEIAKQNVTAFRLEILE